jgi:hypothetical protein
MDKNAIRNILTIMIVVFLGLPVSAEVLGTYTTNEYFYLPAYGEFGEEAFDEYNLYMQKADTQIQANKEAIVDWTVDQDPLKIHANNYVDNDTKYTAGTGMQLDGNTFKCTVTDTNTTYSAGTGLKLTDTTFSSTITQYTDNLAISAIKNDNAWNASNWDTAYGWGDHSTKGYLTSESDPVFTASDVYSVTTADITNWDTAYGWGDWSGEGFITGVVWGDITGTLSNQTDLNTALGNKLANVSEDTTPEAGGNFVMGDYNITGIGRASFTQEYDNGSKSANFTIDFDVDQKQKVTLTANTMTLTLDTTSVGVANYLLKIVNGGLATLTWAAESGNVYFPGGTDPELTSSGTDIVTFYFDGTDWFGMAGLDFK